MGLNWRRLRNAERPRRFIDRYAPRRYNWMPTMDVRHRRAINAKLDQIDELAADGVAFRPDYRLPPWKQQRQVEAAVAPRVDFKGMKVRLIPAQSDSGFPTHFS